MSKEIPGGAFAQATGSAMFAAPWQSHRELRLHELAREYIDRTEAYDRIVCTGPILRGGIMPVTSEERRLCTHNAISVRDRLFSQVRELGFGWGDWIHAIQRAYRESPNDKMSERLTNQEDGGVK